MVGVEKTHGRKDTAAMLKFWLFCRLNARRTVGGTSASLISMRPSPPSGTDLLVNWRTASSPGSRHPKCCRDIEELLEAGIMFSLPSTFSIWKVCNDVVSGVTGIQVRVPCPILF
ncbi:hypothetical protein ACNKHM_03380 [Shigella sonnei]